MRSIRVALAVGLLCAATAATGCGDDSGDDDDDVIDGGDDDDDADAGIDAPAAPATLDDICAADGLFPDLFGQFVECNPLVEIFLGEVPSDAEFSAACYGQFEPYVNDGTITLGDGAALAACLDYIEGLTCADLEIIDAGPCNDLFVGTVPLDGECEHDEQCIGEAYCLVDAKAGGCGACTARLADGEECTEDAECVSDHCRVDRLCGDLSPVGESCGGSDDCLGDAYCSDPGAECTQPLGDGEDCASDEECGFPTSGLYCDPDGGTCTAQVAVGEACNAFAACDVFAFETCDFQDTGECLAATTAELDETCGVVNGARCAAGLQCSNPIQNGTCFEPGGPGDACDDQDPAQACGFLLSCTDATCQYVDYSGVCPVPE